MAADPARLLARQAALAGYEVDRVPRGDAEHVFGIMLGWNFTATRHPAGSWSVTVKRPGWPRSLMTVTELRRILKAQTPHDLGRR